MNLLKAWGVLVLVFAFSVGAAAQTFRGTILGTVTDKSGGTVPKAKVTVRNVDTGLTRETQTTDDGGYTVPELPIGNYTVTVEKTGFQTSVTTGVRVHVGAFERRVDVILQPGEVTQRVEVSGETLPMVETTSDVLGGSFESKQVLDLPVNGRDYTKLLIMVPGANGEPNGGGDSPGSFGLFSANGNRGRANNFLLDGSDMNDGYRNLPAINQGGVFGTPGTVLPLEVIAEVRILSNFQAEYGRNSGAVVNIVTKSGTNDLHGSAFEYFRNDHLNARNFFNSVGPKDRFRNNQFGGSLGGPIVKDKTFWYVAYEGQREGLSVTSLNVVPALSDYAAAVGVLGGDTTKCTSTIIACIRGNSSVINPVILNLFNLCASKGGCSGGKDLWPAVNVPGAPAGSTNSVVGAPASNDANSFIVKIDQSLNRNNQLTGRYFFGNSNQSFPLGLAGGNNLPGTNTFAPIRTQLVAVSLVSTLSSNKVNEARFGWNRYRNGFFAADRDVFGNPNTTFGLNNGVTNPRDFGLPTIRFTTFSFLGSSPFSNPRDRVDTNWQFIDGFSWKIGKHDVKFGYEFRRTAVDSFNDFSARGVLVFDTLDEFLSGTPTGNVLFSSRSITNNTDRQARQNSHAFYVQDSFRWTTRFTLNLGVRWDYFGVIHEEKGRFSVYDPNVGLIHRDPLYDKDFNNFSPRASVAWDLTGKGKTVVRAGFGVFYDVFSQDAFTGQIFENSFNAGLAYNPISPAADAVLVLKPPTLPFTVAANQPVFTRDVTSDAATVQKSFRTPYIYNYNLNIQQELFHNAVLQVGYVGSAGRKLLRFLDINQPTQAQITAADLSCTPAPCVFDPIPRGSPGFPGFTANLSSLEPFPPFVVNQLEAAATSNYNSLQVSLTQQNWRNLTNQITYTYSHSTDTASDSQDYVPNAAQPQDSTNPRSNKGPSNFDVRQRFVWSATYEFPKWAALGRMGEGWQVSSVLTLMSGHPFHLNYNFIDDYSGSGEFFDRPDVVGPIRYNRSDPTKFLDLASFKIPCSYPTGGGDGFADTCVPGSRHFGNLGRNALLGPDYRNWDFAVSKITRLGERFRLLLRADFYNLTNHPNFANPLAVAFFADAAPNRTGANPTGIDLVTGRSLGFSPITATSDVGLGNPILGGGGPRSIQFALKLLF
jgi:hypothetical protein